MAGGHPGTSLAQSSPERGVLARFPLLAMPIVAEFDTRTLEATPLSTIARQRIKAAIRDGGPEAQAKRGDGSLFPPTKFSSRFSRDVQVFQLRQPCEAAPDLAKPGSCD